jgi:hypothetical protein
MDSNDNNNITTASTAKTTKLMGNQSTVDSEDNKADGKSINGNRRQIRKEYN